MRPRVSCLALVLAGACTLGPPLRRAPSPESNLPVVKLAEQVTEIELDDVRYSPALKRVLVPGGGLGTVNLIDPETRAIQRIGGFLTSPGEHDEGVNSVDEGEGRLFAAGRTARSLYVIDPKEERVVASAALESVPGMVRFVAASREVWVSEPDKGGIEVFSLPAPPEVAPVRTAFVPITNGPQRMVVDARRGKVYVNMWSGATVVVDAVTHQRVGQWDNLCASAAGLALDEERGFLFVGCSDGRLMTLAADRSGEKLAEWTLDAELDTLAFAPKQGRLYIPRDRQATMAVVEVGPHGELRHTGDAPSANHAHCLTTDEAGVVWLCDADRAAMVYFAEGTRAPP